MCIRKAFGLIIPPHYSHQPIQADVEYDNRHTKSTKCTSSPHNPKQDQLTALELSCEESSGAQCAESLGTSFGKPPWGTSALHNFAIGRIHLCSLADFIRYIRMQEDFIFLVS